ncbi:hypothetical protein C3941_01840 [Kaistia algarum]|uniref:hypothetical protein n=1 Tax=Kaistia algarum TaxID=2083279 RepID=UPI000CE779C0|nr:hypothetical protein [Kaistia algarum]MCX5513038.1 hypothetical protein [Kaistia algarum]PPE81481.1 hypothetical protein C3941_01840 [Kaistia algarum]
MTLKLSRIAALGLGLLTGLAVLPVDWAALRSGSLMPQAEAVVGRPLTPMSYAGVARRTPYYHPAPVVVVPPPVVVRPPVVVVAPRPGCYQVVNAYGQLTWRCP